MKLTTRSCVNSAYGNVSMRVHDVMPIVPSGRSLSRAITTRLPFSMRSLTTRSSSDDHVGAGRVAIGAVVADEHAGVLEDVRDRLPRNLDVRRVDVRIGRDVDADSGHDFDIALRRQMPAGAGRVAGVAVVDLAGHGCGDGDVRCAGALGGRHAIAVRRRCPVRVEGVVEVSATLRRHERARQIGARVVGRQAAVVPAGGEREHERHGRHHHHGARKQRIATDAHGHATSTSRSRSASTTPSIGTRTCAMLSRSRIVTAWSSSTVWKSTVTHSGVPISSCRR